MRMFHPENERMKRAYLQHVREVKGLGETALDTIAAAIDRFQRHTKGKSFKRFHIEQVVAFKRAFENETNRHGKPLSASTRRSVLHALKGFFHWLADQTGYKRRISHSDAEYFNLDNRSAALANTSTPVAYPSIAQIEHVLRQMPHETPTEKRDRALLAFAILTGARVAALNSARLANVDLEEGLFYQDAKLIKTKFSKSFSTWFFPVSKLALEIFTDYYHWLTTELLLGPGDPLFPATEVTHVEGKGFEGSQLSRRFRKTTNAVRTTFDRAFTEAGLPYYHPHTFRHTLGAIGKKCCTPPETLQAWSQNLGHEDAATLMQHYGKVAPARQGEIIRQLITKA